MVLPLVLLLLKDFLVLLLVTITCSSGFMITAGDFARLAQMPMADGYPATTPGTCTRT